MSVNPADFGATVIKIDPAQFGALSNIDEERGAPFNVRTAVGVSKNPQDKLLTLQNFYKDAQPWGQDNFVFTDPDTGNRTLYNPKGLDMGDVTESGRVIAEFLGGTIGGGLAAIGGQLGPQIALPEEAVTVPLAVGAGAAAGGKAYDAIMHLFNPSVDQRTYLEQAAEMGTDVVANAVGVKVGEVLEKSVKGLSSKAKGYSAEVAGAFKRTGVDPTAGAVSGSKAFQGIEQALSKLPSTADMMGKKYTKLIDDMGQYAEKVASGVSPIEGKEAAGAAIKEGADKFVKKFNNKASVLYDKVDEFIPPNTKVPATNFGSKLDDTLKEFSSDPEFAEILTSPLLKNMQKAYEGSQKKGGMSYSTLKALRTKIGRAIDDRSLIGDTSQGELKQLYGALSDDMTMAASQVGPEALKAAQRAGAFWSAGRSRIDDILNPVVNKKLSHDIFNASMTGSKHSGQKLRAIKKSLPIEEWNGLVSTQIREMGKATPGAQDATGELFSPATFLTNYNKLSVGAQKTLFSGPQYKGLSTAIDDLVKVSASLKDVAQMANTSGTAHQLMYMQVLTGAGIGGGQAAGRGEDVSEGALTGIGIGLAAPWVAAKLITSPKFINWLSDAGTTAVTQNGIGAHLARLAVIAEKDNELAPAIHEYMRTIQGPSNEQ